MREGRGREANKLIGAGDICSQRCCWRRRTTRAQFIPVFALFVLQRKAEQAERESENVFVCEKERKRELSMRRKRKRRRLKSDINVEKTDREPRRRIVEIRRI